MVRHVKHQEDAALYSIISVKKLNRGLTQPVKPDPCAANKPDKRVTRASARIATKESSKATNLKSNMVKKVEPKSKAAHNNKLKEKVSYCITLFCMEYSTGLSSGRCQVPQATNICLREIVITDFMKAIKTLALLFFETR